MANVPHLHAIDSYRYDETELAKLATFTLPQPLECEHCALRLAMTTDQTNTVPDSKTASAFAPQIEKLQAAVNADHEEGHPHWRFLTDGEAVIGRNKGKSGWVRLA